MNNDYCNWLLESHGAKKAMENKKYERPETSAELYAHHC